jgi:CubicO group peptidase (beta-lactamase class C family)
MGYSGEGYEYVRRALENKFGKSLQQIATEELFTPLTMKETRYGWDNSLDSNRFAEAHNSKGVRYPDQKLKAIIAADWLVTTLSDYCRFGLFVINGGGLSNNLYKEMSAIQVNFDTVATHRSTGMGLGWQVIKNLPNGEFALAHSGSDNGAKTVVLLLPKSKRGIVIFTNGENGNNVKNNILKASLPDLKSELAKYMGEFR